MFLPDENHYFDYQNKIKKGLSSYLPGERAQYKMAPIDRPTKETDHRTKTAGVLLLLFPDETNISTVLIRRSVYDGAHSGQISLPGGKKENNDKTLIDTALRETNEEIGISIMDVEILGKLTPLYIPVSNILVQPVIGSLTYKPEFIPYIREVEQIYTVKLSELSNPKCISNEVFIEKDKKFEAPSYKVKNLQIWGATAMILSEFLELHQEVCTNSLR